DRPGQPGDEGGALAGQPVAQDPDTVQLAVRRDLPDDPGARRAVPEQVGVRPFAQLDPSVRVQLDGHAALDRADGGMVAVDTAVDDGDLDTASRRVAERPFAGDRGFERERDGGRQSPLIELLRPRRPHGTAALRTCPRNSRTRRVAVARSAGPAWLSS